MPSKRRILEPAGRAQRLDRRRVVALGDAADSEVELQDRIEEAKARVR